MTFSGLFPPITTPFVDGDVRPDHLASNLERWNAMPLDGYVVLGSNGEAPLLDEDERTEVIRTARKGIAPGRRMIVGAGRESTRATNRCVAEAFDLGADAVLVGLPTYYRPAMTAEVLREHLLRVADESAGPVFLYSVPAFTAMPVDLALYRELIGHDRIVGIKDSSGDAASTAAFIEAGGTVLVGAGRVLAEGLHAGAAGAVLAVSCVAAGVTAEIGGLVRDGRLDEARRLNARLDPLTAAVTSRHGIGGLKAALDLLHLHGGAPRPPLLPAGAEARAEIAGHLRELGLLT